MADPSSRPHTLPAQGTILIGRDRELAAVRGLLRGGRLVTLTGPGGAGKTRLALAAAATLAPQFADGVYFVPLAPVRHPGLVLPAIATTLGVIERRHQPLILTLADHLAGRQMLLVLDNFEQVTAAGYWVSNLLIAAPGVQVLVTSRERLHLPDEIEFPVPPLALPDLRRLPDPAALLGVAAVALFVARAREAKPGFDLAPANAAAVAAICVRLDGLPLAIELAAAGSRQFTPAALLARLDSRLPLSEAYSTRPARQQTLRATIGWSYDLLGPPAQSLLRRLAVFAGGWTAEAAAAICAGDGLAEYEVPGLLDQLVAKSLVCEDETPAGTARYRLLETIRAYAGDQSREAGDTLAWCRRHRDWYLRLAEDGTAHLHENWGADWWVRLDVEHDNLRAALTWSLEQGEVEIAMRLSRALWEFWLAHGHLSEARRWLQAALDEGEHLPAAARGPVLIQMGTLARNQGDYEEAQVLLAEGLALCRAVGDSRNTASALTGLGLVALDQGDYAAAEPPFLESLALWRALGDSESSTIALNSLGWAARYRGALAQARAYFQESLRYRRDAGNPRRIASSLYNLADLAGAEGRHALAGVLYQESLALLRAVGDKLVMVFCLEGLAGVRGAQGQAAEAAYLFGAAEALRAIMEMPILPVDRAAYDAGVAAARAGRAPRAWAAAWQMGHAALLDDVLAVATAGQGLPLDQVIAAALADPGSATAPRC